MKKLLLLIFTLSLLIFNSQSIIAQTAKATNNVVFKLRTNKNISDLNKEIQEKDIDIPDKEKLFTPVFPAYKNSIQKSGKQNNIDLSLYYQLDNISTDISTKNLLKTLKKCKSIDYAELKKDQKLLYIPNDSLNIAEQYYLEKIMAYQAWDIQKGDSSIIIAITDTGIDIDHEDLVYNIAYNHDDPLDGIDNDNDGYVDNFRGWDLGDNDNSPQTDYNEHGTLVSGLAAAKTDNGKGISGPGFKCPLLPIKISDADSLLTMGYEGIVYAADHGASVINCSWGNHYYSRFEQDMINYAVFNKDAIVVAACGNDNSMQNFYPASYDNVLSVAATTKEDEKWTPQNTGTNGGSSYGYHVDLAAPGTMMHTTEDGGTYRMVYAGTSFASPVVAGVAALVRSEFPQLSALQVLERLKNTCDNIDTIPENTAYAGLMGTGRLNAYNALSHNFKPGIVFRNINISDDSENNYQNSDTVAISGEFYNFLAKAENTDVQISCDNQNINLLTTNINIGTLDSLQSFSVQPIKFEITDHSENNENVVIKLNITADNYQKTQYIETRINPSWKTIDNGLISLSIPSNGRIGFADLYRDYGKGISYGNLYDLFYDAGMMVGTSSENIIQCIRSQNEFTNTGKSEYTSYPDASEAIISSFDAVDAINNTDLNITQTTIAPNNNQNLLLISYSFYNNNSVSIDDLYAGLFFDWDLIKYHRNISGFNQEKSYAYTKHTGDLKLFSAIKILGVQNFNHYAIDQRNSDNSIVDLSDTFSDEEKFYCLSNTNHNPVTSAQGSDVSQIYSAGPLNIPPQDSVKIVFALMLADNESQLNAASDSAVSFYNRNIIESGLAVSDKTGDISIYPNPAKNHFIVGLPDGERNGQLNIINTSGINVFKKELNNSFSTIKPGLKTGSYILEVKTDKSVNRRQLFILD